MPRIAYLECARCGHHLPAETAQTVCPDDAGPLYVRYDMDNLRRTAHRDNIAARATASTASLGMWRYADVLPEAAPITLGEGWTPLRRSRRYPGLHLKDEGANPTGSIHARGISLAVTMAQHYGLKHLAAASTGNSASALAAYAAAAGITAHLYMPQDVPHAHHLESVLCGADVRLIAGSISECVRLLTETIQQQRTQAAAPEEIWFNVSTWNEPFRTEGQKTIGYEVVEQLGWQYPDAVICPTSGDVIGIGKAFDEMEQLGWVAGRRPRLYALNPRDNGILLDIVRRSGGSIVTSTDDEILASLRDWAQHEGLFLSPQGAAATAAYNKLLAGAEIKPSDNVVLINPEAALKSTDTLAQAIHLRRPHLLPRSLPVGGIITPV